MLESYNNLTYYSVTSAIALKLFFIKINDCF